jgi:hypothetical protein
MSRETQVLIALLSSGEPGATVSDAELKAACGKSTGVRGDGYAFLQTAIRHCERNHGVVWRRVKGAKAIRCCSSQERIGLSESVRDRQRRMSRRSLIVLSSANGADMSDQERSQVLAHLAMHGAMLQFTDKAKLAAAQTGNADWQKYLSAVR